MAHTRFLYYMLNSASILVTVMLLLGVAFGGNRNQPLNRLFYAMLLLNFAGFVFEATILVLLGDTGEVAWFLIRLAEYLSHAAGILQCVVFAVYLRRYLRMKTSEASVGLFRLVWCFCAAGFLLACIAQFNGMYAYFDEYNIYHQQSTYWVGYLFTSLSMLVCLHIVLSHRRYLGRRECISLLLYLTVPVLFSALETLYEGLYIGYVGTTISLFFIYINVQLELAVEVRKKEAELAENRVALMLSQIQPHFLYNVLGTISALCDIDARLAKESVVDFGHYLRGNMESITQKEPIPFRDELAHVEAYLSLEKKRFGERLAVAYDIRTTDFRLPALTLQVLVENAVRHGVTKRREGGTVWVRTWETPEEWRAEVSDDGVGFDAERKGEDGRTHIGIENARTRLESMCGGSLSVESAPGRGATATIAVPKRRANA